MDYEKYYSDKMTCLARLIRVNEEFLSQIEDWESYDTHLSERDALIENLHGLNAKYGEDALCHCTTKQASEMDAALDLVLALDRDISSAMEKNRLVTLESMKATTKNKKISVYGYIDSVEQGGRLLDRKE